MTARSTIPPRDRYQPSRDRNGAVSRRLRIARPSRAGVTLLELVVSITLVGMISVGIVYALSVGMRALDRTTDRFAANRRVLGAQRTLELQVSSLIPVRGGCQGNRSFFFQGSPYAVRFVTSYTLEEGALGYPRIVDFQVIPRAEGGVRLVQNEYPYTGAPSLRFFCGPAVELGPRPFVLADSLAFCRLSYLIEEPGSRRRAWMPEHARGNILPRAIRFEMAPLQPDPSRLQMATMLVPLAIQRDPRFDYVDIEPPAAQ